MQLVCIVFDWAVTGAFLFYALVILFVPRARLHPLISATLAWGFLIYACDYFFVEFGHTTIGGHDYSQYTTLLTPMFAGIALVSLAFMPVAVEFVIVTLIFMMICGWYNFDTTLSVAFTAAFITVTIVGFLRLAYIMQAFLVAVVVSALFSISVFAMIVQINLAHTDLILDPVCDDHINMILVCDIRCSQILNDPSGFMHSFWVVLFVVLIVFRLLVVFRLSPDIWDEAQMRSLCWCFPCCRCCKCCRNVKVNSDRMLPPPGMKWIRWEDAKKELDDQKELDDRNKQRRREARIKEVANKHQGHHSQYERVGDPCDAELNLDEDDDIELEFEGDEAGEPIEAL